MNNKKLTKKEIHLIRAGLVGAFGILLSFRGIDSPSLVGRSAGKIADSLIDEMKLSELEIEN